MNSEELGSLEILWSGFRVPISSTVGMRVKIWGCVLVSCLRYLRVNMFDKVLAEFVSLQVIGPFVCDNSSVSDCNVEGKNITQSQNASISTVLLGEDSFLKTLPFQTVYYVTEKRGQAREFCAFFIFVFPWKNFNFLKFFFCWMWCIAASQNILDVFPTITGLLNCSFVTNTLSILVKQRCAPAKTAILHIWISFVVLSSVMILLIIFWVLANVRNSNQRHLASILPQEETMRSRPFHVMPK